MFHILDRAADRVRRASLRLHADRARVPKSARYHTDTSPTIADTRVEIRNRARSIGSCRAYLRKPGWCNNGTTPALVIGMDDAIKTDLADRIESLTSTIAALLAQGRVDSAAAAIELRDAQIDALARVIEGR